MKVHFVVIAVLFAFCQLGIVLGLPNSYKAWLRRTLTQHGRELPIPVRSHMERMVGDRSVEYVFILFFAVSGVAVYFLQKSAYCMAQRDVVTLLISV